MTKQTKHMRRTTPLIHLATRVYNTPLMIDRDKMDVILSVLGPRIGLLDMPIVDPEDDMDEDADGDGYSIVNGIARICIQGTLVKRATGLTPKSGMQTYDEICEMVTDAATNPNVNGIILDIDSPGGEASGMFDAASAIASVRGLKPIYAVANDSAYSAAYALASAADRIYVTQTGGVGSVGCYMLHVDQSQMDKMDGLKYTYIAAGDKKVEGNPHEPLSDAAYADCMSQVVRLRDMFAVLVSSNRGVDLQAVLDTQAGCYYAADAVPLLADKVGNCDDAVADMLGYLGAKADTTSASDEDAEQENPFTGATVKMATSMTGLQAASFTWSSLPKSLESGSVPDSMLNSLFWIAYKSGGAAEYGTAKQSAPVVAVRSFKAQLGTKDLISGCAAPYNSLSIDLGGFREVYEPGCFRESLEANGYDARVLFNHNSDYVLGRKSADTARFFEAADGVHVEATAPDTQWARDLQTSMRRGDITQMSAAFLIQKYRWETRGGTKIRVIEKAKLIEASVASFAAYESTSVAVETQQPVAATTPSAAQDTHEIELAGARLQLLKSAY